MIKSVNRTLELAQVFIGSLPLLFFLFIFTMLWFNATKDAMAALAFIVSLCIFVFFISVIVQNVRRKRWIRRRHELMLRYAAEHKIPAVDILNTRQLSINLEDMGSRDERFDHSYGSADLLYGEYSFAIYRKTKYGEYKAETVYYAVCAARLPRALPNLFFDAKKTKGGEFKRLFHASQRHSLEGDFDTYFDTYFPTHYSLDSLSFITPEVMHAMIEAHDYDIELHGDRLFLYAPLRPMPGQFTDMMGRADNIRKKLLNNIVTYRDQRLEYEKGRQDVSEVGAALRRNLTGRYVGAFFGLVLLIFWAAGFVFGDFFSWQLLLFGGFTFVANALPIHKEHARWKHLDNLNKFIS